MSLINIFGALLVGTLLLLVFLYKLRQEKKKRQAQKEVAMRDHVYLHQLGKGPYAPSLTPFAIKFETFLRLTNTPYTNVRDNKRGPKGKIPWMEYNDKVMGDSQLCIDYLKEVRNIKINDKLTEVELAIGRTVQRMVDEHTYWILVQYRWVNDEERAMIKRAKWRWISRQLVPYIAKKQTYYQGIGRHKPEELDHILRADFKALSSLLADKDYFFGDSLTEVDCSVFGQLSQFLWQLPHTTTAAILKKDFNNLYRYCLRVKENYWPDWNDCVMYPEESDLISK